MIKKIFIILFLAIFLTNFIYAEDCDGYSMDDAGCSPGWSPQCFINDCENCGIWENWYDIYGNPLCYNCYFCVEDNPGSQTPICPDHAPQYCEALGGCITTQPEMLRACDCYKKTCISSCISKTLNYNGVCILGGTCEYETIGVECCSNTDCGDGLICRGYSCLKDELGKNLDFEFWTTDFSPQYWDVETSNYMFVQKASGITGSFSLGLIMPSTDLIGGVDIFGCLYTQVSQEIDLTDIDELTYNCDGSNGFSCSSEYAPFREGEDYPLRYKTYIGSNEYPMQTGLNTINVQSYTGIHKIKFHTSLCYEGAMEYGRIGTWGWQTRIDNVKLIGSSLAQLEAELQAKIDIIRSLEGNLIEQSQLISDLEINLESKIILVQSLTSSIDEQIILISQLETNLEEKIQITIQLSSQIDEQALIIVSLTSNVDEQALIIQNLNLQISQQAEMINQLTINLQQKADLVSQLQVTNEEQAELISFMELSFSDQAGIINALNKEIEDDAVIISNLGLTLEEQGILISNLELTNKEQAELISAMELSLLDQAGIINALNKEIEDDAVIISNLGLTIEEQGILISNLKLTNIEQVVLIAELKISLEEEKDLVSELRDTIEAQQSLIDDIQQYKAGQKIIWWIIGGIIFIILIMLIMVLIVKKKR